jgi:hypothetical protein
MAASGSVHAGVQRLDGGVVPLGDLAQVDVAQHLAAQLQLARGNALDVDHRHHATDHGGELHQALFGQVFVLQRRVGGAEVHRLGLDLAHAGARADGLVVDLHAGGLVVVGSPLGVQRRREARARAGAPAGLVPSSRAMRLLRPPGGELRRQSWPAASRTLISVCGNRVTPSSSWASERPLRCMGLQHLQRADDAVAGGVAVQRQQVARAFAAQLPTTASASPSST